MAKKNGNWKYLLGTLLTLIAFSVAIGGSWKSNEAKTKAVDVKVDESIRHTAELKKDGCDPSEEANDRALVLETKYEYLKQGQDELKSGQKSIMTSQRVLLEEIRKH